MSTDAQAAAFQLYPFRFRRMGNQELLVNEVGEFHFAPEGTTANVVARRTLRNTSLYNDLIAKHFIYDDTSYKLADVLVTRYRTKKAFLGRGIGLQIIVITLRCDHECRYCQSSSKPLLAKNYDLSDENIERCIALVMQSSGPAFTLEVQGGEPLVVKDSLRFLIDKARLSAELLGKNLTPVVSTTLSLADRDILEFFREKNVEISTSLDGPQHVHDHCRIHSGGGSYRVIMRGMELAKEIVGVEHISALTSVSSYSLGFPHEIVDEFVQQGLRTIFLRRMSRLGRAATCPELWQYPMEQFMEFYFHALDYILSLNRSGVDIAEAYAGIMLQKILTPFSAGYVNVQSPPGPGTSVVVYYCNGDVYCQDEGRMLAETGDSSFRLGNVEADDYESIFHNPQLIAMLKDSCPESLPGCAECAYLPYCGCDPVFNYAEQGTVAGSRPTSDWCAFNTALCDYLFGLIRDGSRETQRILMAWAQRISLAEAQQRGVDTC
jgi:His-Xaa-Ser system radical SAM maturase HxsB